MGFTRFVYEFKLADQSLDQVCQVVGFFNPFPQNWFVLKADFFSIGGVMVFSGLFLHVRMFAQNWCFPGHSGLEYPTFWQKIIFLAHFLKRMVTSDLI